ncbi:MAG: ABC transporter ATP-binding protein [Dehalococcoidia bacterium]|jgi:ABC-type lipoprotein export system ATPase subunit|uniref:ABC transporter ATP-binding protein n=1 Tax=Candidatus Amarobacter glycogenicus TaxID=3140699 RepID=UPI001D44102C|nr:ABC transporter ATP-binding protein [Dehalococcoidia bacterium]MBK6560071.1 ABC transporter ATP-binding protein [Dehalococcoidia bacterium]MBK7125671.1 ABC transporter ATP-binding protein [Dehalococcoidia bacterium]MBK7724317.1 ABC transporter ATP-binding protein [Dehalococcoidia bacterium]MBK9342307.1 ABC transporter ATP-binding protein [Dehalococcoidia bacterium]
MAVLRVENLTLEIPGRRLLDNISFDLERGESIAIMGPSGAGKTSLINCVCGIVKPTSGRIWLVDSEVTLQTASKRAASRLANVGYVFQFGELLPEISVLENVALPLKLRGVPWDDAERRAAHQLETVGLANRGRDSPDVLSGGEVQRVAVSRAMVTEPALILADEPTGALDEENSSRVCDLIFSLATTFGAAVVVGTHNPEVASRAHRSVILRDGRIDARARIGLPS